MDNQNSIQPQVTQSAPAPVYSPSPAAPKSTPAKANVPMLPALIVALAIVVAALIPAVLQSSASKQQQDKMATTNELLKKMQESNELIGSYKSSIKDDQYQAVFIKGGQVYFGKITKLDAAFITLEDIYYLRVEQDVQGASTATKDTSLAKLGNELHGPEDKMIIATGDVSFWENLKADGQVAKAIAAFKSSNR
jgi:hypothetical protein